MSSQETEVKGIIELMKARGLDARTAAIKYGIPCRRLGDVIRMVNAELGLKADEDEMYDIRPADDE